MAKIMPAAKCGGAVAGLLTRKTKPDTCPLPPP